MAYIARTGQQTFKSITVPNSRPSKDKVLKQFESFGGHYSGYTVAKHLAIAARAVYSSKKVYEGNMEQEEWPQGWEPIGDGFYGLEKQKMMKSKIVGDSTGVHAATVLKWTGLKQSNIPFNKGDILIACRGTGTGAEAQTDLNITKAKFKDPGNENVVIGKTHAGFFHQYSALFFGKRGQEDSLVEAVLKENAGVIYITGHSLGGAMTHLGALGIYLALGWPTKFKFKTVPLIRLCSFAAPRVCNAHFPPNKLWQAFNRALGAPSKRKIDAAVRIVNMHDPVPNVPGQSLAGLRGGISLVGKSAKSAGALVTAPLGALVDTLNISSSLLQGRWSHPSFNKLRFNDNGREYGHPHSMALYEHIMLQEPTRLALDIQDRIFK